MAGVLSIRQRSWGKGSRALGLERRRVGLGGAGEGEECRGARSLEGETSGCLENLAASVHFDMLIGICLGFHGGLTVFYLLYLSIKQSMPFIADISKMKMSQIREELGKLVAGLVFLLASRSRFCYWIAVTWDRCSPSWAVW